MTSLELNEGDRQMVLLALAHLSIERPGWEDALHTLALMIDSQADGRALMFDEFRRLHRGSSVDLAINNATGRPLEVSGVQLAGKLSITIKDASEAKGSSRS